MVEPKTLPTSIGAKKTSIQQKSTKKTEDWEAYKEHRKEFKKELRKRKRETWRSFCSDITSTASAVRLKRPHTSTRFPKERRWHLYSHLRRVRRTFAANYVSRQHKDYLLFQKGCSRSAPTQLRLEIVKNGNKALPLRLLTSPSS
ncbi:hypothetical protein Zmor_013998 [Zophobas morio]|uniref:Uncharacterized protein n=1 Tax=Zophobas morio TaxID=2755281 RepID=A0AA38IEK9_9CUCU|nr:hypothetical protein Zmor_013998 [Zophobas morio]